MNFKTLFGVLLLWPLFASAQQTPQIDATQTPNSGVTMTITPEKNPITAHEHAMLTLEIANHTEKLLVLTFAPQISSFHIIIFDEYHRVPKETENGCRIHLSHGCVGGDGIGPGSTQTIFVEAGKTLSLVIDVSDEYALIAPSAYTISLSEMDFVMVDAPLDANLFDLRGYTRARIGEVRSNPILFQVTP